MSAQQQIVWRYLSKPEKLIWMSYFAFHYSQDLEEVHCINGPFDMLNKNGKLFRVLSDR